MKKLKLDFQHLGNAEVLTRSQMKKVLGGKRDNGGLPIISGCAGNEHVCYTEGDLNYTCTTIYKSNGDVEACCCGHYAGNVACEQ